MRKIILISTFLVLSNVWEYVVFGQQPAAHQKDRALVHYSLKHWTTEKGLPSSQLLDICQTPDGYLWMSSYLGVIRFDGFSFTVFNEGNTPAFESNSFMGVHVAADSTLWVYSPNVGLYTYRKGTFHKYEDDHGSGFIKYPEQSSSIWALRLGYEPFYYSHNTLSFPGTDTIISSIQLNQAIEGTDGTIYLGTSKGLFSLKDGKLQHFDKGDGLKNEFVISLWLDKKSDLLWLGTQSGLFYFDGKTFEEEPKCRSLDIKELLGDDHGNVWMGTKSGLYRISKSKQVERLSTENGLSHNHIPIIFIDEEDNIWLLPLKGGLTRIKDNKFIVYDEGVGLDAEVINTVCETEAGVFLTGSDEGIIHRLEGNTVTHLETEHSLEDTRIRHIMQDSKGKLWISTYGGLLTRDASGKEMWFSPENGFPTSLIRLAYEDSEGVVWIGTRDVGIIRMFPHGEYEVIDRKKGMDANLIMSFEETKDGHMLVGTSGAGLHVLRDGEVIKRFGLEEGLTGTVVFNTLTDDSGIIWVACNSGLSRIEDGVITAYDLEKGVTLDSPYDIIEDHLGNFWIPSPAGLIRVKKAAMNRFAQEQGYPPEMEIFDKYDGIPFEGINPVAQSLKTDENLIWIPTLNGLLSVDPANIPLNTTPPHVHIQQLFTEHDTIDSNGDVLIKASAQRLTINYTAICLQAPETVKFRYKLEGYDVNWTETGSNIRSVSYTNLPAGDYTFRVTASNNDGIWNEEGDKLAFKVAPYWFETWVFRITALLILLILIYTIYKVRIVRLNRQKAALERTIAARTTEIRKQNNELKELNITKDKFFNIIAHDLRNPFNAIRGLAEILQEKLKDYEDEELDRLAAALRSSGDEAYKLLDNLLNWARAQTGRMEYEPERFELTKLVDNVLELKNNTAREKEILINLEIPDGLKVYADKNMLEAVIRNLLSNAIKFSYRGREIYLRAMEREKDVLVWVSDEGIGMSQGTIENIFSIDEKTTTPGTEDEIGTGLGLLLCKEFITTHKGRIWAESEIGKGSAFYFTLPKNLD